MSRAFTRRQVLAAAAGAMLGFGACQKQETASDKPELVLRYAEIEIIDMAALVVMAGTIDPALMQSFEVMAPAGAPPAVLPASDQPR